MQIRKGELFHNCRSFISFWSNSHQRLLRGRHRAALCRVLLVSVMVIRAASHCSSPSAGRGGLQARTAPGGTSTWSRGGTSTWSWGGTSTWSWGGTSTWSRGGTSTWSRGRTSTWSRGGTSTWSWGVLSDCVHVTGQ